MLRLDRAGRKLVTVDRRALPDAGLRERGDLQQVIRSSPDAFFGEMGEQLLLLAEEFRPSAHVGDRIDLLAIDDEGALVVIELKRGSHKLHLLQSLSYAAMLSRIEAERIFELRAAFTGQNADDAKEEIERFLDDDLTSMNQIQRVILIAEEYDFEVLATAEWLWERHDIDIRCYRLVLSVDGAAEYVSCTSIYPPPEIAQHARRRSRIPVGGSRSGSWTEALARTESMEVRQFFESEIAAGREGNPSKSWLRFYINDRRMYGVGLRRRFAYAIQLGRFGGDEEFWKQRLGEDAEVKTRAEGRRLRFRLRSAAQFAAFRTALDTELSRKSFLKVPDESDGDPEAEVETDS